MKKIDLVSVAACILMLISIVIPHFISFKTSRIAFGTPVSAKTCFGEFYYLLIAAIILLLILAFIKRESKLLNFITGALAASMMALFVWGVSARYEYLPFEVTGSARMSFGVGFLLVIAALYSIMIKCSQPLKAVPRAVISLLAWGAIAWLLYRGQLNHYSVMQEYLAAKDQFFQNVWQHLKLSLGVLVTAVIIGLPVGYLCHKHKVLDSITLVGISIAETIPTLALFAIMRVPLAYLKDTFPILQKWGIGSFGVAPAFAALLLYALYLIIHNSRAAFSTIDQGLIENAYAMGMDVDGSFFSGTDSNGNANTTVRDSDDPCKHSCGCNVGQLYRSRGPWNLHCKWHQFFVNRYAAFGSYTDICADSGSGLCDAIFISIYNPWKESG